MSRKYAHVRELEGEAASLLAAAYRQWWRPWRNHKRYAEARRLLARAGREQDLIAQRSRDFRDAAARRRRWNAELAEGFQQETEDGQ